METLELNSQEILEIRELLIELKNKFPNATEDEFLDDARFYASQLPMRVQQFYYDLKTDFQHSGISIIKGFPHLESRSTPASWDYKDAYTPSLDLDYLSVLASSCLGYVFGWSTQQAGKLIHDLIPQKNKGESQTGYGSNTELLMHTEDSFHDLRAEYVCMFGVRNDDKVPTTLASIKDFKLDENNFEILYNKSCQLLPDESHLDEAQLSGDVSEAMENEASNLHTFYGCKSNPFMCYDPAYTNFDTLEKDFLHAYNELKEEIADKTHDVVIEPGDICIIDNRKVVHGRRAYFPKFDGTERWLKRISITTNIRKSAGQRPDLNSRTVGV